MDTKYLDHYRCFIRSGPMTTQFWKVWLIIWHPFRIIPVILKNLPMTTKRRARISTRAVMAERDWRGLSGWENSFSYKLHPWYPRWKMSGKDCTQSLRSVIRPLLSWTCQNIQGTGWKDMWICWDNLSPPQQDIYTCSHRIGIRFQTFHSRREGNQTQG